MPFPQPAPDPDAIPRNGLLALFGPTGVGKTAVALCVADALRAAGRTPVAVSADALQVYQGLEIITGVPTAAERARLEHLLVSIVPVDATFSVGQYADLAHAEIDALLDQGATPIVVGGTGLYLRAALAELELRPQLPHDVRARWEAELEALRAGAAARAAGPARPVGGGGDRPGGPPPHRPRARAAGHGGARAAGRPEPAVDGRHAPADPARRTRARPRRALRPDRRARAGHDRPRGDRRGPRRAGRRRLGDGAQGARLRRAARRGRGGDAAAHAQLRQAPAHLDAQAGGGRGARHQRAATRRRSPPRSSRAPAAP